MTTSLADSLAARGYLSEALRLDLIGPEDESCERLPYAPSRWYLTGFLVPAGAPSGQRGQDEGEELDDPAEPFHGGDDAGTPDRGSGKRIFLPSSLGLSILADETAAQIEATVSWGDYALEEEEFDERARPGSRPWVRRPRRESVTVVLATVTPGESTSFDIPGSGGLKLVCLVRPTRARTADGNLAARAISLFVVNRRSPAEEDDLQDTAYAFQVRLTLDADQPFVPRRDLSGLDSDDWDERLADLHYRDAAEYAVGHNVSSCADRDSGGCRSVRTEWMPQAIVERIEPSTIADVEFKMEALGNFVDAVAAKRDLDPLVKQYRDWIDGQRVAAGGFRGRRREIAKELVERATLAANRIQAGIDLLSVPEVLEAFRIANRAMAAAARRRQSDGREPEWRPFQLAYILMNLRGIADPKHVEREFVDLLFFPTGGGKTEAYLGLSAFTLVLRRLRNPAVGKGLSVLMRYTLRLLTLDQLGRAAALICALELEREKAPGRLGDWPFEIALWVGRAATPNQMGRKGDRRDHTARAKTLRFASDTSREPPLPLDRCPWCAAPFSKRSFRLHPNTNEPTDLHVHCASRRCDFSAKPLPVVAVDEPIYRRLPCFMIATVDKFAGMPWTEETARFFNGGDPDRPNPPDLIIQDELHLISGPLGTMAGLYETAIDCLCRRQIGDRHARPKIIASTATVRLANKQIRALFDRSSVSVFPAQGIDRRDSFFARQADEGDGRLYLGVAAQGRGPKVVFLRSMIALMAAAQAAWEAAGDRDPNPADPYMTAIAYFNALRELGSARRIVEDEVGTRLQSYADRKHLDETVGFFANRAIATEPVELTSRVGTAEVAEAKRRLALDFRQEEERIDVALATNMISVGLDIVRLGLMVISGQPKTTSEYIQATSRVGRDPSRPGLVVTLLNLHKPRDRSHYERFPAYHESFYRGVEATSVTPFSPRALDRGLPAVAVAAARLGIPALTSLLAAADVEKHEAETRQVAEAVGERARNHADGLDAEFGDHVRSLTQSLIDDWAKLARDAGEGGVNLGYKRSSGVTVPLLREIIDPDRNTLNDVQLRFRAPRSLRDVEPGVLLGIKSPEGTDIQ